MDGEPQALKDKWLESGLLCPNCDKKTLAKYSGGVDVKPGNVTHTPFIYHCDACQTNYTQEEFDSYMKKL